MAGSGALSKADILRLFELLNEELARDNVQGELCLVGGAVMCIAFDARASTADVDAAFQPSAVVRAAAARVARREEIAEDWLNDGVKGFLSPDGDFEPFKEYSHLKVLTARPQYLLAMKCMAMRLGAEFSDEDDVRFLLKYLKISSADDALAIATKYFDESRIPTKTRFALQEILR